MKIVVFVEYFPPKMGSDRRIFELMKKLSKRHEIHFIIFPPFRMLTSKAGNSIKRRTPLHENVLMTCEKITGHFIRIPDLIAATWHASILAAYLLTAPLLLIKTTKMLAKLKPDILVLNYPSPYTGLLGFIAGRLWKKPIVLDFNDLIAQYIINLLNIKKHGFKARMLIRIQNYLAKKSKRVIVPTFFIKNYATSHGVSEVKITYIPNGVDTKSFNSQKYNYKVTKKKLERDERKTCLYCGRLDSWAGINIISKLCTMAFRRKINVDFILVGSGSQKVTQKENITLCGERPYEEMPRILSTADIVIVPFPNNEISHAASPLKLFEGMAMEKPIIASRVSGIEEIISDGENGLLADPENINEWIEKVEILVNSENLSARIGKNARKTVEEKFDWSILALQYENVLKEVIQKSKNIAYE